MVRPLVVEDVLAGSSGSKSTNCRRRLIRDFKRLSTDPPGGVSGSPCPDNIMLWNAVIFGPGASRPFVLEARSDR